MSKPKFPEGHEGPEWSRERIGEPWPRMEPDYIIAKERWRAFYSGTGPNPNLLPPLETLKDVERWRIALESMPEFRRMKYQRNCAVALAIALTIWTLFCMTLMQRLIER